jgi:hypothetical protein
MTHTGNQDRAYTIYRCTETSARSTSGNLTATEASIERDRQSQQTTAPGVWIEMRRN